MLLAPLEPDDAVSLFLERARSVVADYGSTSDDVAAVESGAAIAVRQLGVCAGPIPLSAIEALVDSSATAEETLDRLDELLEFSFVRRQEDRRLGIRFLVPQALRDFALERLLELGAEEEVRRLHAEHIAKVAYDARLLKWGATADQRTSLLAIAGEIRPAAA